MLLFFKYLITFIPSVVLFVSVIPELITDDEIYY